MMSEMAPTDQPQPTLVIVENNEAMCELVREVAKELGFRTRCFHSGDQFLETPDALHSDVLVLDLNMPGKNGIAVLEELAKHQPETAIYLFSGADSAVLDAVRNNGWANALRMRGAIQKPVRSKQLREILSRALPSTA